VSALTKSAVVALTRVLSKELGGREIRVNAIAPGPTVTEGTAQAGFLGSDMERQTIAATPLGRLGQPADITPIAVFLASDDSGWINGDTIFASGGAAVALAADNTTTCESEGYQPDSESSFAAVPGRWSREWSVGRGHPTVPRATSPSVGPVEWTT
jgi:hypothetical protein